MSEKIPHSSEQEYPDDQAGVHDPEINEIDEDLLEKFEKARKNLYEKDPDYRALEDEYEILRQFINFVITDLPDFRTEEENKAYEEEIKSGRVLSMKDWHVPDGEDVNEFYNRMARAINALHNKYPREEDGNTFGSTNEHILSRLGKRLGTIFGFIDKITRNKLEKTKGVMEMDGLVLKYRDAKNMLFAELEGLMAGISFTQELKRYREVHSK